MPADLSRTIIAHLLAAEEDLLVAGPAEFVQLPTSRGNGDGYLFVTDQKLLHVGGRPPRVSWAASRGQMRTTECRPSLRPGTSELAIVYSSDHRSGRAEACLSVTDQLALEVEAILRRAPQADW